MPDNFLTSALSIIYEHAYRDAGVRPAPAFADKPEFKDDEKGNAHIRFNGLGLSPLRYSGAGRNPVVYIIHSRVSGNDHHRQAAQSVTRKIRQP